MIARCVVALGVCLWAGTAPADEDFDRAAAAHMAHIVVSGPKNPDHVPIQDPDESNSFLSSLADALANPWNRYEVSEKPYATMGRKDFDRVLEERHVEYGTELKAAIVAAMKADGYTIQDEPSYNTDGSLNVDIEQAWYTGNALTPVLTPEMIVHARFVDMNSHAVLFDRRYFYSVSTKLGTVTPFPPDAKYAFADYDSVLADPDNAVAGLRAAIPPIAAAIGYDLEK
jgi:hypothetical protein